MAITIIEGEDRFARIHNLGDALWYGIATITTIGYGDVTPSTFAGRVVGIVLMLGGATLFSAFTASVASVLIAQRIKEGRGLESVKQDGHLINCDGTNMRSACSRRSSTAGPDSIFRS